MPDIITIINDAAMRGHQVVCVHGEQCPGPSDMEVMVACAVLNSATPQLFRSLSQEVTAVHTAMQNGHQAPGGPDAKARTSDELLREWFHWWREQDRQPVMPNALHVQTVAYLAAHAVEHGHRVRSPADV